MTATMFDFQDGNGPVLAHRHLNGRGWVVETARVTDTTNVCFFLEDHSLRAEFFVKISI